MRTKRQLGLHCGSSSDVHEQLVRNGQLSRLIVLLVGNCAEMLDLVEQAAFQPAMLKLRELTKALRCRPSTGKVARTDINRQNACITEFHRRSQHFLKVPRCYNNGAHTPATHKLSHKHTSTPRLLPSPLPQSTLTHIHSHAHIHLHTTNTHSHTLVLTPTHTTHDTHADTQTPT